MSHKSTAVRRAPSHGLSDVLSNFGDASPMTLIRALLSLSRAAGSNAMSYHAPIKQGSLKSDPPYLYFASGSALSRSKLSGRVKAGIGRCHKYVLREGRPFSLLTLVPAFRSIDPEMTDKIMAGVNRRGVLDEYMIPVYGPFSRNAVISFGFEVPVAEINRADLRELEVASRFVHDRIVRHFGKGTDDVTLSKREQTVLEWIARGKSNGDIAVIIGVSQSTVDTYLRRIFKKLRVNDRISATIKAMKTGSIDPEINQ